MIYFKKIKDSFLTIFFLWTMLSYLNCYLLYIFVKTLGKRYFLIYFLLDITYMVCYNKSVLKDRIKNILNFKRSDDVWVHIMVIK